PDRVFDNADKIELVDIEPDDLIARLNSGKVYKSSQAKRALENFFTKENLVALREIALRRTADQINSKSEKITAKTTQDYYTNEHILICLSSSPSNAKVIRTASRMANAFHGKFTALFVETPNTKEFSKNNINSLRANVKLAEQLGANIVTIYGDNIPKQIAYYASISNVSKLVIGRSNNKRRLFSKQSFIETLTELAPNLEIYVIPDNLKLYNNKTNNKKLKIVTPKLIDTLKSLFILTIVTLLSFLLYNLGFKESNIITIY
ncbi:histidine kinase, partial [Clostridium saudiense]|nr:histidine kinase [Clostridium saudiense]